MRIVVVGGGIAGASAAYHASGLGAEVVLVDQPLLGRATDAGAGIICPWASQVEDPHGFRLAADGARYYTPLIAELTEAGERDLGYRRVGELNIATEDEQLERILRRTVARRASLDDTGDVEILDADQTRELFPPLAADFRAVHIPSAARVDGRLMRDALLRQAERRGTRVRRGRAAMERVGDRVTGVEVVGDGGVVEADAVILAAGAWTADALAAIGLRASVTPQRGQIVHLQLPGADTSRWPVVQPHSSSHYMLTFDDSRVVVGATRETGSGFDHRVTAAGLAEVLNEALSVAPGLARATHLETRIGFRPMGPDVRPLLGPVPGIAGLIVATGLGPTGLTMGPWTGRLAALLATGNDAGLDPAPYDPLRQGS
jgi:D-amino-acid dehydrogenase